MKPESYNTAPLPIRLLVRLFGQQNAIFAPPRKPREPDWPWRWIAIHRYPRFGMAWRSGASDNLEAKHLEHALKQLQSAGHVKCHRPHNAKTLSVRLTDRGHEVAAALADMPGILCGTQACIKLHELRDHPDSQGEEVSAYFPERPWISEYLLVDGVNNLDRDYSKATTSDLFLTMILFRPTFVRGWVEFNSDARGHVRLRLSPRGLDVVESRLIPTIPDDLPEVLDGAPDAYRAAFDAALSTLMASKEQSQELGMIPLCVSMPTKRDAADCTTGGTR